MRPEEREDRRYSSGVRNPVGEVESKLFSYLPPKPSLVLDVGCGVGDVSLELTRLGMKVYGIDFSPKAVELAQSAGVQAAVYDVDSLGLPGDPETYDVIWMGDVLEHVFDPLFLLTEAQRVLRPGGSLLLSLPNDLTIRKRWEMGVLGRSPQSKTYRRLRQCKHHTVVSLELIKFFLADSCFKIHSLEGLVNMPLVNKKTWVKSEALIAMFGQSFVISATNGVRAQ